MKFEYRYEDQGDEWEVCDGSKFWDASDVAEFVAEKYFEEGDPVNTNDFEFEIDVREFEKPETMQRFIVTADYSVNFYARKAK
jgi:hypothetical protein